MAKEQRSRFDSWRIWVTAFGWLAVFLSTAIAAHKVERFVSTDPQFTFSTQRRDAITITGVKNASRWGITRVFLPDSGRSIYLMPLAERRRRLLAIDWVEDASVSRLWPNRVLVRITERKPVAFVNLPLTANTHAARLSLIDAEGVFLEPPPSVRFTFPILEGVSESQREPDRKVRVAAMQHLLEELGPLAQDVSEINAANTEDMLVIAQVDGRAMELELGDGGFAKRYQHFVKHYPEVKRRTPRATAFDLRLENTIITKE